MPLKKATAVLNPMGIVNSSKPQGPQSTTTDASGTFHFSNLQPGSYRVMIQHQNYPQARFGGVSKTIDVKAGETAGPIDAELIPGASVSGRILDEDGEPTQGCFVQAHLPSAPDQGVQAQGNFNPNEKGEYRLYAIPPGKYLLTAQCQGQVFQPRPFSAGPDPPPSRGYPPQYYPLAADAKSAQAVELLPGNEKSGIDFRMRPAPVTQVHGAVSAGGADWKGNNINVQLVPIDSSRRNGNNFSNIDAAKGTFEFRQVFPGSYMLIAFSQGNNDTRIGATQRVEVGDQPLNIVIELQHGFDITGKVELDPESAAKVAAANTAANAPGSSAPMAPGNNRFNGFTPAPFSLSQVSIQLFPAYQVGIPMPNTQVAADGSFTLKGVMPGSWRLIVNGPQAFTKGAWLGSAEVTQGTFELSSGGAGALRIVLSTNTGSIHGSAPPGQIISSQRIDDSPQFRGSRGTMADPSGQYKLDGLAPGRYRIMLSDGGGPMPDEGGQEVTVKEGDTITLDLKPTPVP